MTYAQISATLASHSFSVNQLTESRLVVNETYAHIRIDCSFDSRAGDRWADGQLDGTGRAMTQLSPSTYVELHQNTNRAPITR